MIKIPAVDTNLPAIVVDIGNTQIAMGLWQGDEVNSPVSTPTNDLCAFEEAFATVVASVSKQEIGAAVLGAVVPDVLKSIQHVVREALDREPLVVGDRLPLPMEVGVDDAKAVGVDRVCTAAAAYDKIEAGCVVVDFGTAVTVDLVDDEGVFLGGAILPGLSLQRRSLHEHAVQLPHVQIEAPSDAPIDIPKLPYGRNTVEAIQTGTARGLVGAVRNLVEGYAASLNRWPQVVATGGDLGLLLPLCDFIDTPVANLTLRGIGLSYTKHLSEMGV